MTKKKSDPQKPIVDKDNATQSAALERGLPKGELSPQSNVERRPSAEKPQEVLSMSDGEYIRTRVTEDMLQDPNEPGINPLDKAARQLEAKFFWSGKPVYRSRRRPGAQPTLQVNFIPRRKQRMMPEENK